MTSLEKPTLDPNLPERQTPRSLSEFARSATAGPWLVGMGLIGFSALIHLLIREAAVQWILGLPALLAGLYLTYRNRFVWIDSSKRTYRQIGGIPGLVSLSRGSTTAEFAGITICRETHVDDFFALASWTVYAVPLQWGWALALRRYTSTSIHDVENGAAHTSAILEGKRIAGELGIPFHNAAAFSLEPPPDVQVIRDMLYVRPLSGNDYFAVGVRQGRVFVGAFRNGQGEWLFNLPLSQVSELHLHRLSSRRAPYLRIPSYGPSDGYYYFGQDLREEAIFWIYEWLHHKLITSQPELE